MARSSASGLRVETNRLTPSVRAWRGGFDDTSVPRVSSYRITGIACAVSIDPVDGAAAFAPPFPWFPSITPDRMDEVDEPIIYLGTTHDSLFSPGDENFHEFFTHSTVYAQEIEFQVGDHVSFAGALAGDLAAFLHLPFGSTPEFDLLVQNYSIRYSVAWLKVHLEGDTSFETHLTGPDAQQDVADGWILFDTIN